jgi:hypothetical protein
VILALLAAAGVQAAVLSDSYLGTATAPRAAPDQVLTGRRIHLHLDMDRIQEPGAVVVVWYYRGHLVKRSLITVRRRFHYSACPVLTAAGRRRTGEWTAMARDQRGRMRSHQFSVR